jgi:hypothetical protein
MPLLPLRGLSVLGMYVPFCRVGNREAESFSVILVNISRINCLLLASHQIVTSPSTDATIVTDINLPEIINLSSLLLDEYLFLLQYIVEVE